MTTAADHLARCAQLLRAAEAFEQAEDWDNAVAKYRELNELDHLYQGAESKLLFAVRERECARNYADGKAHMAAGRFAEAKASFHKAKARAGFYKDTNALIAECERRLTGGNGAPVSQSPTQIHTKKGCLGVLLFFVRG